MTVFLNRLTGTQPGLAVRPSLDLTASRPQPIGTGRGDHGNEARVKLRCRRRGEASSRSSGPRSSPSCGRFARYAAVPVRNSGSSTRTWPIRMNGSKSGRWRAGRIICEKSPACPMMTARYWREHPRSSGTPPDPHGTSRSTLLPALAMRPSARRCWCHTRTLERKLRSPTSDRR